MNKKNKKGAIGVGMFVVVFMGIIVALAMFGPIADTTGDMTNIRTVTLANYTTSATINDSITLPGREATTVITVVNATNPSDDWTANFDLVETTATGALGIRLKTTDAADAAGQGGELASVTYSYKPQGYNDSSGARGIVGIILIFAALTIMAFAYGPVREALGSIGIGN
jgi:hypothetical protein